MQVVHQGRVQVTADQLDPAVIHNALHDAPKENVETFSRQRACVDVATCRLEEDLVATVFAQLRNC